MIDPYIWLTPILVLGVMSLIRFIGCQLVFKLEETELVPPSELAAAAGDELIDLSWFYETGEASSFTVTFDTDPQGAFAGKIFVTPSSGSRHGVTVPNLVNGVVHHFRVTATAGDNRSRAVTISATPSARAFVLSVDSTGPLRNDFTGWVGMAILVAPGASLTVTRLGRIVLAGNTQAHDVKIVDAASGADLGIATVLPGGAVGSFAFGSLFPPVTLLGNGAYFVMSHEENLRDQWFDQPTFVTTTAVAAITSHVFSPDGPPTYQIGGGAGQMFVPVSFQY